MVIIPVLIDLLGIDKQRWQIQLYVYHLFLVRLFVRIAKWIFGLFKKTKDIEDPLKKCENGIRAVCLSFFATFSLWAVVKDIERLDD